MRSKKTTKIAVLGVSGMLGYAVSTYFHQNNYHVVKIDRRNYDILKEPLNKLEKLISKVDVVINCTGVIKPRISSMKTEDVFLVNGIFPKNLSKLCKRLDKKCFHITTDCVFSGKKGKYSEEDYFDINDIYGLSKCAGESTECMTLRTSIIGEEINNKYSLLEWAKSEKGKQVSGFTNHLWNGVTTIYLAEIIENIIAKKLYKEGLFHIFSSNSLSKSDLVKAISDIYNLDLKIIPTKAPDALDRTLGSVYSLSRKVSNKPLVQQIQEMHDFFVSLNY